MNLVSVINFENRRVSNCEGKEINVENGVIAYITNLFMTDIRNLQ
jgi:hypothetical protein